jgi:sugar phosphate isomerase/epimerase
MKLGISQLAFNSDAELYNIVPHLKQSNISNVEIVIPKILDWNEPNFDLLDVYVKGLQDVGLTCTSTQSITFNKPLIDFSSKEFFSHLEKVSKLCKFVEIDTIVLGAPKLRTFFDREYLSYNFKVLDTLLRTNRQTLCIEPNCSYYGGLFFISLDEIVDFIKINKYTNIKTMIDVHNILLEDHDPTEEYVKYKKYIHHVHISEVGLGLFETSHIHTKLSQCLKQHDYRGSITYEATSGTDIRKLIDSITQFSNTYSTTN